MKNIIKEICPVCQGAGEQSDYYSTFECSHCEGLGRLVSDEAREILTLMQLVAQASERSQARQQERDLQRSQE